MLPQKNYVPNAISPPKYIVLLVLPGSIRISHICLKRKEGVHIPLPEAHVEWDHCDPNILSGLLVHVAQFQPGVVLKSEMSSKLRRMRSICRKRQRL